MSGQTDRQHGLVAFSLKAAVIAVWCGVVGGVFSHLLFKEPIIVPPLAFLICPALAFLCGLLNFRQASNLLRASRGSLIDRVAKWFGSDWRLGLWSAICLGASISLPQLGKPGALQSGVLVTFLTIAYGAGVALARWCCKSANGSGPSPAE
jgi:hypothetical protein